MVKRLTKLPLRIEFEEDEDETGKRKQLKREKNSKSNPIGLHVEGVGQQCDSSSKNG